MTLLILHHSVVYVRSVRFKIIEKYILQTSDIGIFFMVIQMIGGTLTDIIHDVQEAGVFLCRRS